jgi:hypothetical protein
MTHPIRAPWVLIDDVTVNQTASLLERLTLWLEDPDTTAVARCALALSIGETDDPITISRWADALAAQLRQRAEHSTIDPDLTP